MSAEALLTFHYCPVCEDRLDTEADGEAHAALCADEAQGQRLRVSRSAIADRQLCEQRRYWGYHALGGGLSPAVEPTALVVGNLGHSWMAQVFAHAQRGMAAPDILRWLAEEGKWSGDGPLLNDEELLAFALAYGWCRQRLAAVLDDYTVVATEEEWPFPIASDLEIPQRMDVILRRKGDGLLVSKDFKTLASWSPDWERKFYHDLQTLLYCEALEQTFGETGGIQYEGMLKGRKSLLKTGADAGEAAYSSILVSPYAVGDALTPLYKAGLTRRKLRTVEEIVAWVTVLATDYPEKLAEQFPVFPLFLPSSTTRSVVLGPVLEAERRFAARLPGATAETFERTPAACLKFGGDHPCPFIPLCWEGGADDPLGTGLFVPRTDHHQDLDSSQEDA